MENVPLLQKTTADLLTRNARIYPAKKAFLFDGTSCTWDEVEKLTDRIAAGLLQKGVKRGSHVGFWSMNTMDVVLYMLAVMKIGAVAAVINYSYRVFELRNVLRRADVECVFLGEYKRGSDYRAMAEEVRDDCPRLKRIDDMAQDLAKIKNMFPLERALPGDTLFDLQRAKDAVAPDDVAAIVFTSGTTKEPKPVMLTHYNIINDVNQFTHRMRVSVENNDVLMAPLPLFHCSGLSGMLFFALVVGIPVLIHRSFTEEIALEDIARYRVTALMAVPSMLDLLLRHKDFGKHDISSLRIVQTSGSATSPVKLREVWEKLGLESLLIGYGQTECSPLITTVLYDDDMETVTKTVGIPFPHEEIRIWNAKNGCQASAGETGEIQVRGFNVMRGYYNFQEEQRVKFTDDGWLKTTDAGYIDERGYLRFVDRISDCIIRHGENISPAEVESVIEQYGEDIIAVKVAGIPEPVVQEEVACLIVTKAGVEIDAVDLKRYVKTQLASFKVPKYIFRVDALPLTATGKIDHGEAKRLMVEMANKKRCISEENAYEHPGLRKTSAGHD